MQIEEAHRHTMTALFAALLLAATTLVLSVISLFGHSIPGVTKWSFVDAALGFALAYGIYRFSRFCAVAMLLYFLIGKALVWIHYGGSVVFGIPLAIGFGYLFIDGIRGTFAYHARV
jgi:hypothetical protein